MGMIMNFIAHENWTAYGIFFTLNLVYVILNNTHTILCIKSKNKWVAAISGAVCYGFYTIVLKSIMGVDTFTTVTATMITNIIGFMIADNISKIIMGRPSTSYKFTIKENMFQTMVDYLLCNDIVAHYVPCYNIKGYIEYKFSVYTKSKEQDKIMDYAIRTFDIELNSHKEEY